MSESRTGFNVRQVCNGGSARGVSGTTSDRRRLLRECGRHLDAGDMSYQQSRNASIVADDAAGNIVWANDSNGGLRETDDLEEIITYGDNRAANVHRKMQESTFETTTVIAFLPKSLCREVPDYYSRDNGPGRSRWVAADADQMQWYFDDVIEFFAENVLTGGRDAIHGVVLNLDESTPHIHIMADTFAPDPKHENKLRVEAQQMWGQHREVTEVRTDADTGATRRVQITGATKMRRYQEQMREYIAERGYDIEMAPDPTATSAGKAEYAALQEAQAAAQDRGTQLDAREAALDTRQSELDAAEADLPKLRARAKAQGRSEGLSEAQSEAVTLRGDAEAKAGEIVRQATAEAERMRSRTEAERDEIASELAAARRARAEDEAARDSVLDNFEGYVRDKYVPYIKSLIPEPPEPAELKQYAPDLFLRAAHKLGVLEHVQNTARDLAVKDHKAKFQGRVPSQSALDMALQKTRAEANAGYRSDSSDTTASHQQSPSRDAGDHSL